MRAPIIRKAEHYAWRSAAAHCGLRSDPVLSPLPPPLPFGTADGPRRLAEKDDEKMLATIRVRTRTGPPPGNKKRIAALESRLGRRLQPRPIG